MRRDYFTVQVTDADWVETDDDVCMPRLNIAYEGPQQSFLSRFKRGSDALVPADEVDVTFRLQADVDDPDAGGVLSLTNRMTGEYLLEVNDAAETMLTFIRAARRYGETTAEDADRFAIDIRTDDHTITYEKRTFLVYDTDGSLLRQHSLIPSGVEI